MKLRLALLITCSAVYFTSKAQDIQVGVTAALNLGTISGKGISPKYQTGFEGGAYATIPITKDVSIQPEVLYDYLKLSRTDDFGTYYVNGSRSSSKPSFNLGYVSIPVLINYRLSPKLTVNAGPQYNILVYSNEDLLYYNRAFKNYDYGIRGGFQFAPSTTVNLFASYYYGIADVSAINNGDNDYKWKNRQLLLGINVTIFTPKKNPKP